MNARSFFLQDNLPSAYFNFGVALHYIQDSYTSFASFYPNHQSWEQQIEASCLVPDIEELIQKSVKNEFQRNKCSWLVQELSREVQGRDNTLRIATLNG